MPVKRSRSVSESISVYQELPIHLNNFKRCNQCLELFESSSAHCVKTSRKCYRKEHLQGSKITTLNW